MTLNCYIIGDTVSSIELLKIFIQNIQDLELVGTESNPLTAMNNLNSGSIKADLTFMDVDMAGKYGLELAAQVQSLTKIIFTTAHRQYAHVAFDLNAIDYLVKPVSHERFIQAIEKAYVFFGCKDGLRTSLDAEPNVFIPGDGKGVSVSIRKDDVCHIRAMSNYMQIFTKEKTYTSYLKIPQLLKLLGPRQFLRTHKSYIVNRRRIKQVNAHTVMMDDGKEFPIGDTFKKDFMLGLGKL